MDVRKAAQVFEDQLATSSAGSLARQTGNGEDENLQMAQQLVALSSRWRRSTPGLRQKVVWISAQAEHSLQQPPERKFGTGMSLLRWGVTTTAAATLFIVLVPAARHTIGYQMSRLLELVRVGPATNVARFEPLNTAESAAVVAEHDRAISAGERWSVQTPYGGFFGGIPANAAHTAVQRVNRLDDITSLTDLPIKLPTGVTYRGRTPIFDHALVAPDGTLLLFFDSGQDELFLMESSVAGGRAFTYTRVNVPELKTERFEVNGQPVLWDPDPTGRWPESSALRWERDGVSYALNARGSLTREEAVQLFLSLQPFDQHRPH